MTTHPKTFKSFAEKSDQYIRDDCAEPPLTEFPQIQELLGNVEGKRILCVGCGGGAECFSLSKRGAVVEGIDTSEALLNLAKTKYPDLRFQLANIEALPYSNNSFDVVYCGHVLHYLRDWAQALDELHRVLSDSGKIVVTIHHPEDHGYIGDEPKEIHAKWYDDFDVVYYPRGIIAMSRAFENSDFRVDKMVELNGEVGCPPITVAFVLGKL